MLQWLLGATLSRLLLPLFLVLFPAKALVVIPLAFEQLLKVRLAVKLTLQCCIASQTQFSFAMLAAETGGVENKLISNQFFHGIHRFIAGSAEFLRRGPHKCHECPPVAGGR